jgi:2-aminobenzoate-CoA ligase
MHFHRDVLAICDAFPRECMDVRSDDVFTGTPPFAFTFGLGGLLLFPMRFGASTAFVEKPGVETLLETIQKHRATTCFTSPTAYRAVLQQIGDYDVSSLRECVSAGEALPAPTFHAWEEATGIKIIDGIGSTEMLHIFIAAADDDIRPGSTGRAVPGYVATVLADDGTEAPPGVAGRLAVRGPTGCRYLADDRQTAYVQDGWNVTGDTYIRDEDGYFWYQARSDDMIVTSGYNVAGPEVEQALLTHPDVAECAVVGLPDPDRGQVVAAFVVLAPGLTPDDDRRRSLQDHVKATIAPYKYPRRLEFQEQLPKTQTGKLQRYRLREDAR